MCFEAFNSTPLCLVQSQAAIFHPDGPARVECQHHGNQLQVASKYWNIYAPRTPLASILRSWPSFLWDSFYGSWIIVLLKLLKQHVAPVATPQLSLIGLENLGEKIPPGEKMTPLRETNTTMFSYLNWRNPEPLLTRLFWGSECSLTAYKR